MQSHDHAKEVNGAPIVTHPSPPPSTPFTHLIPDQRIAVVSSFELSSSPPTTLTAVPLAYRTWGRLNDACDNVMIICHALTGSSDVEDWWGPLLGPGLAFDPARYFIFCGNVLGSPYGTASPVTINPATGKRWGPEFPPTTVRDDVRLQKILLDHLGVKSVAVVIGGSMGGMACLEWPLCTPKGYVRNIVPLATSARHCAWGISWGEAQRQSIYSDPKYLDGWYDPADPPSVGLAAARMAALLTYRSRDSFESRFGRKEQHQVKSQNEDDYASARSPAERAHNDGHRRAMRNKLASQDKQEVGFDPPNSVNGVNPVFSPALAAGWPTPSKPVFSAQSYLRYQGSKFVSRFDANCYIHITRKMDAHDVDRGREAEGGGLAMEPEGALVVAVSSDGLFLAGEQREMADNIPGARLVVVQSPDGHDGFLLEFEQINAYVLSHLQTHFPDIYSAEPLLTAEEAGGTGAPGFKKESVFGEAEGESVTTW